MRLFALTPGLATGVGLRKRRLCPRTLACARQNEFYQRRRLRPVMPPTECEVKARDFAEDHAFCLCHTPDHDCTPPSLRPFLRDEAMKTADREHSFKSVPDRLRRVRTVRSR